MDNNQDYSSIFNFNLPKEEETSPLELDWSCFLEDDICPQMNSHQNHLNGVASFQPQIAQHNNIIPQNNIDQLSDELVEMNNSGDFFSLVDFDFPTASFEGGETNQLQVMETNNNNNNIAANNVFVEGGNGRSTSGGIRRMSRSEKGYNNNNNNNNNKKSCCNLEYEEIQKYFHVPISRAAKEMKVGLTVLKRRCRELNIMRWPHRKIKSLTSLIHNVQEMGLTEELAMLEQHKQLLEFLPDLELTDKTKKLRQACFKATYKKRRASSAPHLN